VARKRPANRWRWPGKYSKARADRAVKFIENLPHVKGEWAGQKIKLMPWQKRIIRDVFGTLNPDGTRQYRTVYIEIPRKNGKTTLASAVALYLLFADSEAGAEIFSAAHDRDQACIAFDLAAEQIRMTPELMKRCSIVDYRKRINHGASFYRAVEREAAGQHGYNAHGVIFDEVHTQKTHDLWDVLTTSTGSRRQPLVFAITTAGFDRQSICWKLHDYARKILAGIVPDPTFYPVIYSAVDDDRMEADIDWLDEKLWRKANPALGTFVKLDEMRAAASRAREIPEQQNTFKRLRENIWTQSETRPINPEDWEACGAGYTEADLKGAAGHGGLDLASTQDVAAFALAFPIGGEVHTLYRFWCPKDTIRKRTHDDGVPYQMWVDQGYMIATEGNAIDFDWVEAEILDLAKKYNIQSIRYDRWQAVQMAQHLEAEGIEMVPVGMGFASLAEPTKEFQRLILAHKLRHTNPPSMRWMIDNLMLETDSAGNVKPSKKKSTEKIDGPVALILALDGVIRTESTEFKSVYEDRGVLTT